jgi:ankyrin repeat protein
MEEEGKREAVMAASQIRLAVKNKDEEKLGRLINRHSAEELKAIVDMEDRNGVTGLMHASQEGYEKIVCMLISAGANVDAAHTGLGTVPLGYAIQFNHDSIAHILLEAGANVNAVTNGGETPLMVAAEKGNGNIVDKLLSAGANVNAETIEGESPLMIAEKGEEKYKEIIDMLKAARLRPGGGQSAADLGITIMPEAQATDAQATDTVYHLESERRGGGKRKSKKKKSKKKKSKKKKTRRKR